MSISLIFLLKWFIVGDSFNFFSSLLHKYGPKYLIELFPYLTVQNFGIMKLLFLNS